MNHIRDKLPDMKARLNTLMGQAQQELNSFGDSAIFGDKGQVSWVFSAWFFRFGKDLI
jgi:dynamin 1-like protein